MPALPHFKYHPDPLATGSIRRDEATCLACGQERGYVYTGPVYSVEELRDELCPFCIADGTAAARFDATFTDAASIAKDVPREVVEEIERRTPGFSGWQQERWWAHCHDGGEFLGRAGYEDVLRYGGELIASLKVEIGYDGREWDEYLEAMDADGQPTAYVFRCRRCRTLGGYSDFT